MIKLELKKSHFTICAHHSLTMPKKKLNNNNILMLKIKNIHLLLLDISHYVNNFFFKSFY